MAVDGGYGPHLEPQFADGGAPDLAVDSNEVAKYAARFGNRMVGTTTQRDNFAGLAWEGLEFEDTDVDATFVYYGGWRVRTWASPPEFNLYGLATSPVQNVGGTAKITMWGGPQAAEKITYTAPGRVTAQYAGVYQVTASLGGDGASGQVLLFKNNVQLPNLQAGSAATLSVSIRLAAGDYLEVFGFSNGNLTVSRMQFRVDWIHG